MMQKGKGLTIISALFLFLVSFISFVFAQEAQMATEGKAKLKENPIALAEKLIDEGKNYEAEKILKEFISTLPSGWKPINEASGEVEIYFWDQPEFIESSVNYTKLIKKNVTWSAKPSYSKAFYLLAFMSVEQRNWTEALKYIDQALTLEPDHPIALCEKAFILGHLKRSQEAYELYMKALKVRPWATDRQRALALRGAGVQLIDFGKLDEAENMLKKSLEFEPNNRIAKDELNYIDNLRKGGRAVEAGTVVKTD